jgi:hypothetical protein
MSGRVAVIDLLSRGCRSLLLLSRATSPSVTCGFRVAISVRGLDCLRGSGEVAPSASPKLLEVVNSPAPPLRQGPTVARNTLRYGLPALRSARSPHKVDSDLDDGDEAFETFEVGRVPRYQRQFLG